MASNGKAVTGTAVMARSANEEKKKKCCFTVLRHACHISSLLSGWFVGCWYFHRGAFVDDFLTGSSRDVTATVLSNAALEKKEASLAQLVEHALRKRMVMRGAMAISILMVPDASNKGIGEKKMADWM